MAKKFVRGITDVKTINNQDFDTNNVNDLLSDGQYNYIHRKKGKSEEYHNLTDNIKTLSSDNTDLLTVTNNNKTNNTATLSPKHDKQKEQVLESTRDTISIQHGTNGTAEKTTVDTNPKKVLEHDNLLTDYGISKTTTGNTTKLGVKHTKVEDNFDLNNLENGNVRCGSFVNAPKTDTWFYVSSFKEGNYIIQEAVTLVDNKNTTYRRTKQEGTWGSWREQVGDKSVIDGLLAQKQDVLTAGDGIKIEGQTVDTNPQKVLEHENLLTDYGISKTTTGNTTKLGLKHTRVDDGYDLNNLLNGKVRAGNFLNAPQENTWFFVTAFSEDQYTVQHAISLTDPTNQSFTRLRANNVWGSWREQVGDKSVIDASINANTEKINQLTARLTALEEKVAQLHPNS